MLLGWPQRTGQRQELLRGPMLYGFAHVLLTLAFWRHHPAGVMGVAALCAGGVGARVGGWLAGVMCVWGVRRLFLLGRGLFDAGKEQVLDARWHNEFVWLTGRARTRRLQAVAGRGQWRFMRTGNRQ